MKRPLLGIAFAFCLGILAEGLLDIPVFYLFGYALLAVLTSALLIRSKTRFLLAIAAGFLFLGALCLKNYTSVPQDHIKNQIAATPESHKGIIARGFVIDKPQTSIAYYNKKRRSFLLGLKAFMINNKWRPASGILLVNAFNANSDFKYGDEVILEGYLQAPRPATNPGQFDYKKFLERKKIFYILNVRKGCFAKPIGCGPVNPVKSAAYKVKEKIDFIIDKFMPVREGAILKAILLGERKAIDEDTNEDFVKTGTVHVLAISGLHVGLLALIFTLIFKLFRIRFEIQAALLAALLIFYCVMVGSNPPVTRSTIMILVFLFGRFIKRGHDLLNTLAISALAILFLNPQDLFDIGFQLSFLTVGSIVYITPRLQEIASNFRAGEKTTRLAMVKRKIILAALTSFAAWLGSAPLIARYFNIISPVTLIANLFVVPWMFFVLATSLTFIALGVFSQALGLIFSEASRLSILILVKTVSMFSAAPFSYFRVKSPSWVFIIGFYIFLLLFLNRELFRIRAKTFLVATLLFCNIFIWRSALRGKEDFLKISFLDVGKGDSIFLEFPKGGTMLIDAGEGMGFNMGRIVVGRFLASQGINKIDAVVCTHPHTDHCGGLTAILRNFEVGSFIENGDTEPNLLYQDCDTLLRQKKVKRFVVKAGDSIRGFDTADILVLNPPPQKFYELNNNSVVLKMRYKDFSALFCGDIKADAAKNLLNQRENLKAEMLKIPHHGGDLGEVAPEFLEAINPEAAIISVGNKKVNSSILLILKELRTRIYRTDINGAIFLITKGEGYSVKTYKK